MQTQNNQIDFSNQNIYIGIDVHKKQWTITTRTNGMMLRTFSMNPSPEELHNYLKKHYQGGNFSSVYEAGFSGYWIDKQLKQLGIKNIVVNPADIPTKNKERANRNDRVDSRKLARELENGNIEPNYIPSELQQEIRSLSRLRQQLTKDMVRIKNRIKGLLLFYGKPIPENHEIRNWSGNFIKYLEALEFNTDIGKETLSALICELKEKKTRIAGVVKSLKKRSTEYGFRKTIDNISSVPGIGFITAITLYTELMDINRFKTLDNLCSYVGLVPSVDSTDEKEYVRGMSRRHSKFLRNILIEASWTAVRKDPALTQSFNKLISRMSKQKAIIRIAKKILNRIRFVWKNEQRYELLVVK
jgi:transposase